jgi:autotransporter-associated beta strand protein
MKARRRLRCLPLLVISASFAAAASNQYWNVASTGGDGIWGTGPGDKNWNLTAGATVGNTTWLDSSNDVAVFQDALGGTVTVFDPVQTSGLSQTGANYTIDAGVITLVPDAATAAPFVHVQTGTLTLNTPLAGSNGLLKTGNGTLLLVNSNTYTGTTAIDAGTLNLTGSLASTDVRIASGGSLIDATGGLGTTTALTNAGTLTINAADTIASLTNTAGTLNGIGTLTVTGATIFTGGTLAAPLTLNGPGGGTFTNATLAGTFNGTTAVDGGTVSGTVNGNTTSNGNVLVSGSLDGGSLHVNSGILNLTGTSTNSPINIATGAALIDANGGLDSTAILANSGTLTVDSADTIATYTQSSTGSLTGTGILTATTIALQGGTVAGNLRGSITTKGGELGDVLVSGTIGGGELTITSRTLTLSGSSSNALVNINDIGILMDVNGGLDSGATVTNEGVLNVGADETIATYTQALRTLNIGGLLTGTGTLTTTGGALLEGGTVAGNLRGNITSTGQTAVSGSIGGGSLDVTGGTLTLTGSLSSFVVNIASGAWLKDYSGGFAETTAVTNGGLLIIGAADTVATYHASGTLIGPEILSATSASLANGAKIFGNLHAATFTTNEQVTIGGTVTADSTRIASGTLRLAPNSWAVITPPGYVFDGATMSNATSPGVLNSATIDIASGATLSDKSGGLADHTLLTNAGTLELRTPDTVASYLSNGGTLSSVIELSTSAFQNDTTVLAAPTTDHTDTLWLQSEPIWWGPGLPPNGSSAFSLNFTLTTTTATLNDGSVVSGGINAGTLASSGAVFVSGSATADSFNIASGVLTNTGMLTATHLNLGTGATLVASGSQQYNLLTTFGPGTGTWQGDLTNPTTVAAGGVGGIGTLRVTGNFTNAPTGTLTLDVSAAGSDLLETGGTAMFGGTLNLNQLSPITPFVPVQVVAAGAYVGNFTTLTENLDGAAWFNTANGTVMTLTLPTATSDGTLYGATANQTAVWTSLYDDVIDPGLSNVTALPGGGYSLTSGIADANNPDLLNALSASFGPNGLNAAMLDRLSPEVYAGFQDYAIQATRSHQRAALNAPSLGFIQAPRCPHPTGSKDAQISPPDANPWEYFAAVDYFDTATDSSPNGADYGLSGYGFIAGARTTISERVRLGGYVAADSGKLDGTLIDADAVGWSLGLFAKALVHERTHTLVSGGLSYGRYSFDGSRGSLIATGGGWTPASTSFSNVDSDALDLFLGISSLMYQDHGIRLLPAASLRYVSGEMNRFAETSGAAGSPIPLAVDRDSYQHVLAELSLRAEADVTAALTLHSALGVSVGLGGDDPAGLNARFATGSRPFRATAAGLGDDALFLGLGANWRVRDNFALGFHWRADFRDDADVENAVGLSTSVQF